jgi:hypothetical protein
MCSWFFLFCYRYTKFILVLISCLIAFSCQKKEQSGLLSHQTVVFSVGSDFEISMPGALPEPIKMITLNGDFQPNRLDEVALLLKHMGSEYLDTIIVKSGFRIENLDSDYFKFINGQNVLKGKIIIRNSDSWRECISGELTFQGQLSIIYNSN